MTRASDCCPRSCSLFAEAVRALFRGLSTEEGFASSSALASLRATSPPARRKVALRCCVRARVRVRVCVRASVRVLMRVACVCVPRQPAPASWPSDCSEASSAPPVPALPASPSVHDDDILPGFSVGLASPSTGCAKRSDAPSVRACAHVCMNARVCVHVRGSTHAEAWPRLLLRGCARAHSPVRV
jgi:hypothetical protein